MQSITLYANNAVYAKVCFATVSYTHLDYIVGLYAVAAVLAGMVVLAGIFMITGSINSNVAQRTSCLLYTSRRHEDAQKDEGAVLAVFGDLAAVHQPPLKGVVDRIEQALSLIHILWRAVLLQ